MALLRSEQGGSPEFPLGRARPGDGRDLSRHNIVSFVTDTSLFRIFHIALYSNMI
jgi:hypothetical protein